MYMGATDVKVRIEGATSKKRLGTPALDYGWKLTDDCYRPDWFSGYPIPENLVMDSTNRNSTVEHDNEFDDGAWTEDSDSEDDS